MSADNAVRGGKLLETCENNSITTSHATTVSEPEISVGEVDHETTFRDVEGLYRAAKLVEIGAFSRKDPSEAFHMYLRAAQKGHIQASLAVSRCYYHGIGIEKNPVLAVEWLEIAANTGCTATMRRVAERFAYGKDISQDLQAASKWYIRAAEQGDILAQLELHRATHHDGLPLPRELRAATLESELAEYLACGFTERAYQVHSVTGVDIAQCGHAFACRYNKPEAVEFFIQQIRQAAYQKSLTLPRTDSVQSTPHTNSQNPNEEVKVEASNSLRKKRSMLVRTFSGLSRPPSSAQATSQMQLAAKNALLHLGTSSQSIPGGGASAVEKTITTVSTLPPPPPTTTTGPQPAIVSGDQPMALPPPPPHSSPASKPLLPPPPPTTKFIAGLPPPPPGVGQKLGSTLPPPPPAVGSKSAPPPPPPPPSATGIQSASQRTSHSASHLSSAHCVAPSSQSSAAIQQADPFPGTGTQWPDSIPMHARNALILAGRKGPLRLSDSEYEIIRKNRHDWPAQVLFADDNSDNAFNLYSHFASKHEEGIGMDDSPKLGTPTIRSVTGYPRVDSHWYRPFFSENADPIATYLFSKMYTKG